MNRPSDAEIIVILRSELRHIQDQQLVYVNDCLRQHISTDPKVAVPLNNRVLVLQAMVFALESVASVSPTEAPKPVAWHFKYRRRVEVTYLKEDEANNARQILTPEAGWTETPLFSHSAAPSPAADPKPAFMRRPVWCDHEKRGIPCNCADLVECKNCTRRIHESEMREHKCPRPAADREAVVKIILAEWTPMSEVTQANNAADQILATYDLTPKRKV